MYILFCVTLKQFTVLVLLLLLLLLLIVTHNKTHSDTHTIHNKRHSDTHTHNKQEKLNDTTKHKNNRQKGDQDKSMAAPSSRPKLLHLVREPRIHKTDALTMAKANLA